MGKKTQTQRLAGLAGTMMLHMVMLEAIIITLAAMVPDEELEHVQAALDTAAEYPGFRREDRRMMGLIADGLMDQIRVRAAEIQGE